MKKLNSIGFIILATVILGAATPGFSQENWKGDTQVAPLEVGAMYGLSLFGSDLNPSLLGTVAKKLNDGILDDVDERLWAEAHFGPTFFSEGSRSATGIQYSLHARWDFTYNADWTFYAVGGAGGFSLPEGFGDKFTLAPRFGVGVNYQTRLPLMFRAEVTSNFVGGGIAFNF